MNSEEYIPPFKRVDGKPMTMNEKNILIFIARAGYNPEELAGYLSLEDITIVLEVEYYRVN